MNSLNKHPKLICLDRDGVINEDRKDYVKSIEEMRLFPQAVKAIKEITQHKIPIVIITNQSVVGRGIISEEKLEEIHIFLNKQINDQGGKIDKIYSCFDHPDKATLRRKPGTDMLKEASQDFNVSPNEIIFIGDQLSDIKASFTFGSKSILVLSGKGEKTLREKELLEFRPFEVYKDLLMAAQQILANKSK